MGLLDFANDKEMVLALGAGLLSGNSANFGTNLGNALMGAMAVRHRGAQAKAAEKKVELEAKEYERRARLYDELTGGGTAPQALPMGGLLGTAAPQAGGDLSSRFNIPPEAMRFAGLTKDPAQTMFEAIQNSVKPHYSQGMGFAWNPETRAHSFIGGAVGPNTFPVMNQGGQLRAQPIQGLSEAIAAQEGAKARAVEGARADLDLIDVPMGGRIVKMPRSEAARILGGQRGQAQPPGMQQGGAPQIPQAVMDANRSGRPFVATMEPGGQPAVSYPGPLGQSLTKAEEAAQVGRVNTQEAATSALNEDFIKSGYRPVMEAADKAGNVLARVQALQKSGMLDKTGWGATQRLYAASVLAAMGVKDASNYAADGETFRKLLMDTNWELLNAAKGPQTEGDAQRALQTFVQLGNQPAANRFILDYTAAAAKLAKDKARHYAEAVQQRGSGDLSQIEQGWIEKNRSIWDLPDMQKWAGGGEAQLPANVVTLPNGKAIRFPGAREAEAFKRQAGLP